MRNLLAVGPSLQSFTLLCSGALQCHCVAHVQYHSTVQYSTVQYSTVQYSAVQYSTIQCTVQFPTCTVATYAMVPAFKMLDAAQHITSKLA